MHAEDPKSFDMRASCLFVLSFPSTMPPSSTPPLSSMPHYIQGQMGVFNKGSKLIADSAMVVHYTSGLTSRDCAVRLIPNQKGR